MRRCVVVVAVMALVACLAGPAGAQEMVVALELPNEGPGRSLARWLDAELGDGVQVLRSYLDEEGAPVVDAACVVAWSEPGRPGRGTRELHRQLRRGGGIVYIIGAGGQHIRRARSFLSPLDVTVREADGGSSAARWVDHPLTEGADEIGAITPGSTSSGVGGNPLVTTPTGAVAMAFDWGPLGRAVIIDQSLLFSPLHTESPRPAVREMLLGAVRWAAAVKTKLQEGGPKEKQGEVDGPPAPAPAPVWEPEEPAEVEPPAQMRASLDVPESGDNWPELRALLTETLERAGLEVDELRAPEGEPLIDHDELERTGLLVLGPSREEVGSFEPLAVGRFFERGGRILVIAHATGRTQKRMIGLNQLLTELSMAISLERRPGRPEPGEHPITRGLRVPDTRMMGGACLWAPLATPLMTIGGGAAAGAWEHGEGRIVFIDGRILLTQRGEDEPFEVFHELLERSIEWLLGEL